MRISDWSSDVCSSDLMFGIDIGDDRYGAVQAQETAVAFIGFHHHPVAGAKPGVGAVAVDDPVIDDGRINVARIKQGRDRKSVMKGTSVSARVDLGGPRCITIKNKQQNTHKY